MVERGIITYTPGSKQQHGDGYQTAQDNVRNKVFDETGGVTCGGCLGPPRHDQQREILDRKAKEEKEVKLEKHDKDLEHLVAIYTYIINMNMIHDE